MIDKLQKPTTTKDVPPEIRKAGLNPPPKTDPPKPAAPAPKTSGGDKK
jgi:hypothetical protein